MDLSFSFYFLTKTSKVSLLYLRRFNELINLAKNEITQNQNIEKSNKNIEEEEIKSIDLPQDLIDDLLEKLILFEEEHHYLQINLKLNDLAKEFETNSSYLSKIINYYKNKNFSQYINDLRIDFTVKKIKKDKKFRKFSIKAIAKEVGFRNRESFAKAFFNKTGFQPSCFIKKIGEN